MSILLENSVYLVYLIFLLMSHVPRRKKDTQSTVPSSETRCFTYLGVHLSVETCFQKWPYSHSCLRATPCIIVGARRNTP